MLALLWLVPALPFAGFLILALAGRRFSRSIIALVGAGSIGTSALVAILIAISFIASPPPDHAYSQTIWRWIDVADFTPTVTLYLDALSTVMVLVVTFVAFLIHLYSVEYMIDDEGQARFFAYMNLFVGAMLVLVLADNLLLLLLGWEGVGLCSYLLIGFWYRDPANGRAARKAFVVTRIGDAALMIGLFLLFNNLDTLQIQPLMSRAVQSWAIGSPIAVAAAALLLGGALGKSAQLPLQTWLPDAMAGPTPVSALIHAATMVTAGVYLIARTSALFALAPPVLSAVAVIGAVTLLYAGLSALAQSDIKRALAYSTISQVGYMFLALGVGAWSAAIFHFMAHAFFKALLFLAAGVVILALNHEQNMLNMGGLRRRLPLAYWPFLVGAASLSAVPFVTAGFYSKDSVLLQVWSSPTGGFWLWLAGVVGAALTALYAFRMLFLTFHGNPKTAIPAAGVQRGILRRIGPAMILPLLVFTILAIVGGFVEIPATLGNVHLLSDFLRPSLPTMDFAPSSLGTETALQVVSAAASLLGILLAYFFVLRAPGFARNTAVQAVAKFWQTGWAFDWLYEQLFTRPFIFLTHSLQNDPLDHIYQGIAQAVRMLHTGLSATESGRLRWYVAGMGVGAAILIGIEILTWY